MPATNQRGDFLLNGAPFMLARDPAHKGRAWVRTGVSDSLSSQRRRYKSLFTDEEYGGLPDELDHPEVHDDWSGGYGDFRRVGGRENHYHYGYNADTRFPRIWFHAQKPNLLPGIKLGGAASAFASCNTNVDFFMDVPLHGVANPPAGSGEVVVLAANTIVALAPTNTQFNFIPSNTLCSAFDATNITSGLAYGHRPQLCGSFAYIPNLNGSGFTQYGIAAFAATSSDCMPARWFQVANGRLWRGYGRGVVQSCAVTADPLVTSNWSATLNLADGNLVSQDAMAFEKLMFVGFPDGLYQGDASGTFSNVLTDIGDGVNIDNIRDIAVHNGGVVVAAGRHVWRYKPSSGSNSELQQIWPTIDVRPLSPLGAVPASQRNLNVNGQVTCLKGFGRWLYAGVFNGSQSQIYCGMEASVGLPYVWHPMQLLGGPDGPHACKVSRIHVDAITASSGGTRIPQRIWVATDATFGAQAGCTAPIYFWPIPANDEQPFADTTFSSNPCAQAVLEESVTDWQSPGTWKVWRKLEVWSETMGSPAGYSLLPQLIIDGTMSSPMSNSQQFSQTPKDYGYFTNANNQAIGQAGQMTYLSTVPTVTLSPTPIYRAIVERGSERPRTVDTIMAKVRIADGVKDRMGATMRPGAAQLGELRTLALSSNPYALVDLVGATLPVVVLPPIEEQEVYQGGSEYPEIVATVKIGVLDASWPVSKQIPFNPRGG